MTQLTVARFTVRKTFDGKLLEERLELLSAHSPKTEIAYLGKLYADKLSTNQRFLEFCENYQQGGKK